jgi:hypothetical protein
VIRSATAKRASDRCRLDHVLMETWTCQHFSLANPRDNGAGDLPQLLRRLADQIESTQIKPMEILDLTISQEATSEGPWWTGTVYWSPHPGIDASA